MANTNVLTTRQKQHLKAEPVAPSRLSKAVELSGLRQRQIAKTLDISETQFSDICRGRYRTLMLSTARSIATYFGVPIEVMFPEDKTKDGLRG